jgi:predicted nucleic acid-binding protein
MTLFVDTSFWYAVTDAADGGNRRAKDVLSHEEALVTSDHVLVETWLLTKSRLGFDAAGKAWDVMQRGADIEPTSATDLERARAIREEFPDQTFSLVDLTSFAVMHRLGLDRVASFDSDFAIYRYGPRRDRAFAVVR